METEHQHTTKPESKIIGLTGGIGSGKSTVANFLEEMGFPVYYSDTRAKEIVNEDPILKAQIINLLGENSYDENGHYNIKYVAKKVFDTDEIRHQLNALVHPAVKKDFENWATVQNKPLIFKETALLFELDLHKACFKSLLVTAEDNIRIKRVMDRDAKTYREVETIIAKQMPEKNKVKLADEVIHNNGSLQELKTQTEKAVDRLITTD